MAVHSLTIAYLFHTLCRSIRSGPGVRARQPSRGDATVPERKLDVRNAFRSESPPKVSARCRAAFFWGLLMHAIY